MDRRGLKQNAYKFRERERGRNDVGGACQRNIVNRVEKIQKCRLELENNKTLWLTGRRCGVKLNIARRTRRMETTSNCIVE